MIAAGWRPDPTWRYEFRWHNGTTWTADVSLHGQRFVDPLGAGSGPAATPPPFHTLPPVTHAGAAGPPPVGHLPAFGPPPRSNGRGMAIASFVVGLSSALLAWVPFVFVLAGMGALCALVFGVVAMRASRAAERGPHGFAIAGLTFSVAALALCVVGFQFTRAVMDELDQLAAAGPHRVSITDCSTTGRLVSVAGSLTNLDDITQTFIIELTVADASSGSVLAFDTVSTGMVDPGDTVEFETTVALAESAPADVECVVRDVRGPSLFEPAP